MRKKSLITNWTRLWKCQPGLVLLAAAGVSCAQVPYAASQTSKQQGSAQVVRVQGQAEYTVASADAESEDAKANASKKKTSAKDWKPLFNGENLEGWKVIDYAGHGDVHVENGQIILPMGITLTGVKSTNDIPKVNYEVSLEAKKLEGNDFFCGLTFPVEGPSCTFIVGGWGGGVVGISSLDGYDASENETARYKKFETGQWYRIRVRVTDAKIECWIDEEQIVEVETEGRKISMRFGEIELSEPFGVSTYQTSAAIRDFKLRRVDSRQ